MRTQRETDLEDEIELLSGQLLAFYARVDELEGNIKVSGGLKCPNCDDVGFTPEQDGYGNWYQEQCEFCYTVPDSIFLRKEAIKALEGEGKGE